MSEVIRQLSLIPETHRNHYLFSDHFLNEVLPGRDVWLESEAEARQALAAIAELYSSLEEALPHYNEAQAEEHWIRPVLNILGHVYEVQPPLVGALGTPDYAFFADEETMQAATPTLGRTVYWTTVLAVGDAKRWDHPLDKRFLNGVPDAFTNANPCYQIDYYLRRTGCAWGIVSNGRRWRLFHQDTSFRLDIFYEVDLVELVAQGDPTAFRYFYLFFRAAAFRPDGEGRCWLDDALSQSTAYAVRVGDELKGRVYEVLRLLAQGFLDYPVDDPEQALDPSTDLSSVHDACLILLYRLLFLLYAESRGLLPLDNPSYAGQYSLKAIKEDIARKTDEGVIYLVKRATLWDGLRTLFGIIHAGQEALGVPAYDGRLFDPARYPFLEERTIGDKYLAQAIDLLARAETGSGQGLSFVDYRDLSIRHLGSIYEGLLEYRLVYATEEMAVVKLGKRGKKEEIIASSEVREGKVVERIPAGQVYLVTDRGERKATGSYYTPDYIVKYIVEQTLGPLADRQAKAVKKEVAALKARNKGGARGTQAYKAELTRLQNSFADRVLALNALDPAMGSGHFLVEATDYLARRIVEAGVVTEALANGDEESELSYWRRRVVERCVYGVDLNPLAVELAKLSLWLATVARGKPLSFLDHHLRCGNSLIGARVADLQALPVRKKKGRKEETEAAQMAMWDESAFTQDMYRVVGAMRQIGEYETADLVSVREKERLFEETVERERQKWRAIANLWTASYFGLEMTPELYNACVQYSQGKPVMLQAAQAEALLHQAHEIWEEKRFFHWEIEFPDVFFDEYGHHTGEAAGFDAVVGNPPYGAAFAGEEKAYLGQRYLSAKGGYDSYLFFIETVVNCCRVGGYASLIVPDTWLILERADDLRRWLLVEGQIIELVDLPQTVFPDAIVDTAIFVLLREPGVQERAPIRIVIYPHHVVLCKLEGEAEGILIQKKDPGRWLESEYARFQIHTTEQVDAMLGRVDMCSERIGDIAETLYGVTPYRKGYGTPSQTQHMIDANAYISSGQSDATWRSYLRGDDIGRYFVDWAGLFIKYGPNLAEPRVPKFFDGPRLMLQAVRNPSLKQRIIAAETCQDHVCNKNVAVLLLPKRNRFYVLAVLNSSLLNWFMSIKSSSYTYLSSSLLRALPIRRIAFTTPPEERERLVEDVVERYYAYLEHGEDVSVRAFVAARLLAEPEQSDVVHDLLAHLAGRMVEMHKEKQAEAGGFLDWLAEYTGRPVDEWTLKTHLRRYYEQDWAEMGRILKRNQRKLPQVALDVKAYKNEPAARIRAAWDTSMDTLRPLLAHIKATDRLIDQIVYQLYGLTEEEIGVVEGRLDHE